MLWNLNNGLDVEMITNEQTPLTSNKMITREDNTITMKEDLSHLSWKEEAHGTIQMVLSKRVFLLSPLFFYTGKSALVLLCHVYM